MLFRSVAPADVAVIEGTATGSTISVKGLKEGKATLKLKATHEGVSQETQIALRVRLEKIQSIDTYRTATAAGVAPILPDSVVANGLEFDEPTPSLKSATKPDFDFAEEFNSRLVPVTWEPVDKAKYAKGQEGKAFTVRGTATYDNKDYVATALVTVKEPAAAAESNSSVTFENVQLNDVFWAPKQEVNAKNSLKKAITEIEKASGGEPNYDNAIKKLNGETDTTHLMDMCSRILIYIRVSKQFPIRFLQRRMTQTRKWQRQESFWRISLTAGLKRLKKYNMPTVILTHSLLCAARVPVAAVRREHTVG